MNFKLSSNGAAPIIRVVQVCSSRSNRRCGSLLFSTSTLLEMKNDAVSKAADNLRMMLRGQVPLRSSRPARAPATAPPTHKPKLTSQEITESQLRPLL